MRWDDGVVRPVALAALGQGYRRYRLADAPAEAAMAGSLRHWGQLAPVVACVRGPKLELLDGFKRWAAASANSPEVLFEAHLDAAREVGFRAAWESRPHHPPELSADEALARWESRKGSGDPGE